MKNRLDILKLFPATDLSVTNLGPIRSAKVRLLPLTVFVGPNNTGKSYLSALIYAILTALPSTQRIPDTRRSEERRNQTWKEFMKGRREEPVLLAELPSELRSNLVQRIRFSFGRFRSQLKKELIRCFSGSLDDLVRRPGKNRLRVSLQTGQPGYDVGLSVSRHELMIDSVWFDESVLLVPTFRDFSLVASVLPLSFWNRRGRPRYLPAARSGIMLTHRALASALARTSALVGVEPLAIPAFSGVIADFVSELVQLDPTDSDFRRRPGGRARDRTVMRTATFIEKMVSLGHFELSVPPEAQYPEITYSRAPELKFSLARASSMVSELAPIVLLLRYAVRIGDTIIIEEPEAHLHPENQRRLACGLARLVNAGVRVVVTTHSDYFLQQLSNLIQASATGLRTAGIAPSEKLDPAHVSVSELRPDGLATVVRPISISEDVGIPDDQFLEVATALHNQSANLSARHKAHK